MPAAHSASNLSARIVGLAMLIDHHRNVWMLSDKLDGRLEVFGEYQNVVDKAASDQL